MSSEQRRVKSVDVAREAGVSQATVSYVLNNNPRQSIPEETRARVIEAARRLGYQPYAPARSLRSGKSKIVLVVWQESVIEAAVSGLIERLARAVAEQGYSLVWHIGFQLEQAHLASNLTPAVVVCMVDDSDPAVMASLQRFHAPLVTFPSPDWISRGARLQASYMLDRWQRPLVYAASEKEQLRHFSLQRGEALRQVCLERGLPEPYTQIVPQQREGARQAIRDLLAVQPPPFSLCAYNDDVAMAALAALADLKLAVPQDVAVIGHDDTMVAELSNPALTSIRVEGDGFIESVIHSVLSACQGGPVLEIGPLRAGVTERASA